MRIPNQAAEPLLKVDRIFDAPRELVFKAWTEPKHVMQWWGPKDFTSPYCTIDLRPGGEFLFCMRGPDGTDIWTKGVYHEIIVPEKIVSTIWFSDKDGRKLKPTDYGMGDDIPHEMDDVVTFEVHAGNKTRLTVRRNTPEAMSKKYGEVQGWNESLDKLAAAVARTLSVR
jgi:uncharacterized protein YndB with AHSA1/START domain